jgi:hypothetical protein
MKKGLPFIIIFILAVVLFAVRQCEQEKSPVTGRQAGGNEKVKEVNRDRGFDRRPSFLRYTEHARCRMDCRRISQAEVEEIMLNGKINYSKSNIKDARCPTYAVEGITADNQRVRIVFGQCNEFTNVVTAIDLNKEWSCHCPGDDKKYENRK